MKWVTGLGTDMNLTCDACPTEGVHCPGYGKKPFAKAGYYMVNRRFAKSREKCIIKEDDSDVCPDEPGSDCNVCKGGITPDCLQDDDCGGDCDEGHTSFLCGVCSPGYSRESYPDRCEECTPVAAVGFIVMAVMWIVTQPPQPTPF